MSSNGALLEARDLKTYFCRRGRFGVVRCHPYSRLLWSAANAQHRTKSLDGHGMGALGAGEA